VALRSRTTRGDDGGVTCHRHFLPVIEDDFRQFLRCLRGGAGRVRAAPDDLEADETHSHPDFCKRRHVIETTAPPETKPTNSDAVSHGGHFVGLASGLRSAAANPQSMPVRSPVLKYTLAIFHPPRRLTISTIGATS
jgi:hypothetical protein